MLLYIFPAVLRPVSGIVSEASIAHEGEIDIARAERMLIRAYYQAMQVKARTYLYVEQKRRAIRNSNQA